MDYSASDLFFLVVYWHREVPTSTYHVYCSDLMTLHVPLFSPKHLKPAFKIYSWDIMIPSIFSILSASVILDPNVSSKLSNMGPYFYRLPWNVGSYITVWCLCLLVYLLSSSVYHLFLLIYSFNQYCTFCINMGGPFIFFIHIII